MGYSFKKHQLSEVEKLWLGEAAKADKFDPRIAKVMLRDKLPKDFDPNSIDQRLYANRRATFIGLWHIDHKHWIFEALDKIIRGIRERVIANPGIQEISTKDIAAAAELSQNQLEQVCTALYFLEGFCSGMAGPPPVPI